MTYKIGALRWTGNPQSPTLLQFIFVHSLIVQNKKVTWVGNSDLLRSPSAIRQSREEQLNNVGPVLAQHLRSLLQHSLTQFLELALSLCSRPFFAPLPISFLLTNMTMSLKIFQQLLMPQSTKSKLLQTAYGQLQTPASCKLPNLCFHLPSSAPVMLNFSRFPNLRSSLLWCQSFASFTSWNMLLPAMSLNVNIQHSCEAFSGHPRQS